MAFPKKLAFLPFIGLFSLMQNGAGQSIFGGYGTPAMLSALEQTEPIPAQDAPAFATYWSAQHPEWPPFPGNANNLPAWPLGNGNFVLSDLDFDYSPPDAETYQAFSRFGNPGGGLFGDSGNDRPMASFTTNDLWLEITGVTNDATGLDAFLTIHPPWDDTNLTWDILYTTDLAPPVTWSFLMRSPATNAIARWLCEPKGFFKLTHTNGDLSVSTNITPLQMAQMLVPSWVAITNATYTGDDRARGVFSGGNGCGLPLDDGLILSTGQITNALGPNNDDGSLRSQYPGGDGSSDLEQPGDDDLNSLVGGGTSTLDAAVLEFDVITTNSFMLEFQYVFASDEYPEWIGSPPFDFNDPMAIFVSTNFNGTRWVNSITNDFALVPGTSNMPVSVNSINGGCTTDAIGRYDAPSNAQYFLDNCDPNYSSATNAAPSPEFNIQYDGMTVLLKARIYIISGVTNHVKIAIADYSDASYDSAVFLKAWHAQQCP